MPCLMNYVAEYVMKYVTDPLMNGLKGVRKHPGARWTLRVLHRCAVHAMPACDTKCDGETLSRPLIRWATTMLEQQLDVRMIDYILELRSKLSKVIAVINGKGGQGKTTTVAQLGGLMAAALASDGSPLRVLIMELDDQGDLCLDLGIKEKPGVDDEGAGLLQTCMGVAPLNPVRNVRPNLDIAPGGKHLAKLAGALSSEQGSPESRLALAKAIAAVSHEYAWILIDCPPKIRNVQDLGLVAARWAVIPVSFDAASIYGMSNVSERLVAARQLNPSLDVLGILIYGLPYRMRKDKETGELTEVGLRARVREKIETALGDSANDIAVFKTIIRETISVAEACRDRGQLVHELAASTDGPTKFDVLQGKANGRPLPTTEAGNLALEWQDVGAEVFGRAMELENQEVA